RRPWHGRVSGRRPASDRVWLASYFLGCVLSVPGPSATADGLFVAFIICHPEEPAAAGDDGPAFVSLTTTTNGRRPILHTRCRHRPRSGRAAHAIFPPPGGGGIQGRGRRGHRGRPRRRRVDHGAAARPLARAPDHGRGRLGA